MTVSQTTADRWLEHAVKMAVEAWDRATVPVLRNAYDASDSDPLYRDAFIAHNRGVFKAAVEERLRQSLQMIVLEADEARP